MSFSSSSGAESSSGGGGGSLLRSAMMNNHHLSHMDSSTSSSSGETTSKRESQIIHLSYMDPGDRNSTPNTTTSSSIDWVQTQLQLQSSLYTENRVLKVAVGSWNVNSRIPGSDFCLEEWLQLNHDPDIIAVGLQEIDMSAQAMIKNETEQCELWAIELDSEIQRAKHKYHRLLAKQMVGLYLGIYVKEQYVDKVKSFRSDMLGLGAMGRMGNKGGVGARFQIYDTSYCFITTHLAPHMEATAKRNQHFHEIFSRLDFGGTYPPDKHDYLFWFGDLNYRIDYDIELVKKCVEDNDIKTLLEYDQLTVEKFAGRVFWGFKEGPITFLPTYKYDPGTLIFDTSAKSRTPSWCDRILWKGKKRDKVKLIKYDRYELLTSDHLPVASLLHTEVSTIIDYRYRSCRERLVREFEQTLNDDNIPDLETSCSKYDFGLVKYDTPVVKTLMLKNVGTVVAEYMFVPRPCEDYISKPWIRIAPTNGVVMPGESAEIKLTICVDHSTGAQDLNIDNEGTNGELCDTLIIHVENGRDYFVQIGGQFQKSCFGSALETLVACHEPIRVVQERKSKDKQVTSEQTDVDAQSGRQNLKIPKELWRLTDYIFKYGMREKGLFQETGDVFEVAQIRDMIDNGESLDAFNGSIHSVSDTLITFLESLKEPIIPTRYYKKCMEIYMSPSKMRKEVINKLPAVHFNAFQYLMSFLREVLLNSDVNNLTPDQLAQGFASIILRSPLNMPEEQKELDRNNKIVILIHFLREENRFAKIPDHKLFKDV